MQRDSPYKRGKLQGQERRGRGRAEPRDTLPPAGGRGREEPHGPAHTGFAQPHSMSGTIILLVSALTSWQVSDTSLVCIHVRVS